VLCLVADAGPDPAVVRDAVAAGVDWVQLRDRRLEGRALQGRARALRDAAIEGLARRDAAAGPDLPCALLLNRRLDVALALASEADDDRVAVGVHLGFDAPPLEATRRAWAELGARPAGPIGVAAHAAEEVAAAAAAGADYAHLAPVFDPLSKPRERPALGTEALARASQEELGACLLIAQGGIDAGNAAAAVRAGAHGVAVTGAILGATHPGDAAARLRATLDASGADVRGSVLSSGPPPAEDD
jgi:thiamine-phosphate pyrophosphorylase